MKPVLIFRHHEWVGPGRLLEALYAKGIASQVISVDHEDAVAPTSAGASGLVFLGADYSVNDPFPWIGNELALIENAVESNVPVLGHCFGAQLISKALGGTVTVMPSQEIGWYKAEVTDTPAAREWFGGSLPDTSVLYWHKEAFSLPAGATSLMGTAFLSDQAFALGENIVATGAHLEVTPGIVRGWVNVYGDELPPPSATTQDGSTILENVEDKIRKMRQLTGLVYDKWLARVITRGSADQ